MLEFEICASEWIDNGWVKYSELEQTHHVCWGGGCCSWANCMLLGLHAVMTGRILALPMRKQKQGGMKQSGQAPLAGESSVGI